MSDETMADDVWLATQNAAAAAHEAIVRLLKLGEVRGLHALVLDAARQAADEIKDEAAAQVTARLWGNGHRREVLNG